MYINTYTYITRTIFHVLCEDLPSLSVIVQVAVPGDLIQTGLGLPPGTDSTRFTDSVISLILSSITDRESDTASTPGVNLSSIVELE